MKACGYKNADAPLSFVMREADFVGPPGWHQDHQVREHGAPFEGPQQGRLGMINGPREWHALWLSFRPPASSPAVPPPDAASSVTAQTPTHTTRFLSVIYPQCHSPFLPLESFKNLFRGGEAKLLWLVPSFPLRCQHEGLFTHDKCNSSQLDLSQMNSLHRHTKGSFTSVLKENLQRESDFCLIPHQTAGMSAANCTTSFH